MGQILKTVKHRRDENGRIVTDARSSEDVSVGTAHSLPLDRDEGRTESAFTDLPWICQVNLAEFAESLVRVAVVQASSFVQPPSRRSTLSVRFCRSVALSR
jgi:hypothetical protein